MNTNQMMMAAGMALALPLVGLAEVAWSGNNYTLKAEKQATAQSIMTPLDFNTAANWSPETVPSTRRDFAVMENPSSGYCFVTSAIPVTVGRIGSSASSTPTANNIYVSEQPLTIAGNGDAEGARTYSMFFLAPVHIAANSHPYCRVLHFCGPLTFGEDATLTEDYWQMYFDFYRWTDSTSSVRINPCGGSNGSLGAIAGVFEFKGPETVNYPNSTSGLFDLTAGSVYGLRSDVENNSSENWPKMPVGTLVTGDGIQEGTFMRRMIPYRNVELSKPATKTLTKAKLTFAPFTSEIRQDFQSFQIWGNGGVTFNLMKFRDADTLVIKFSQFIWPSGNGTVTVGIEGGSYKPGVLSTCGFKSADCENDAKACLYLRNSSEIEITPPNDAATYNEYVKIYQNGAYDVSGISVPEGKTVNLKRIYNWLSTYIKRGPGTLGMDFNCGACGTNPKLTVEQGRCVPTFNNLISNGKQFQNLTVKSDAELALPTNGLPIAASAITLEPNAILDVTVNEDGSITPISLSGTLNLSAGVKFRLIGATKNLQGDAWPIIRADGITSGPLTLEASGSLNARSATLAISGNDLVLNVPRRGFILTIR